MSAAEDSRCCRRWRLAALALAALIAGAAIVVVVPVTTRQGVNYEVVEHRLPLYLKLFEFLDRDAQYRQLAGEITRHARSDRERVKAVFDWTARRIQPAPDGWTIVDDHILNIIIRGYGTSDQRADVFAALTTYAGVPAFWRSIKSPGGRDDVILTFVHLERRWTVVDVANGFMFGNTTGELATADDFAANRAVLPAASRSLIVGSTPYVEIVGHLRMPPVPRPLRAELQMPWPRLWDVAARVVGRRHDDEFEQR
jgi:hypothetical protein